MHGYNMFISYINDDIVESFTHIVVKCVTYCLIYKSKPKPKHVSIMTKMWLTYLDFVKGERLRKGNSYEVFVCLFVDLFNI